MRDKCVGGNESGIFEIDEDVGSEEKRNVGGISISRVGDLSISRTADFILLLSGQSEMALGVKALGEMACVIYEWELLRRRIEFISVGDIFDGANTLSGFALSSRNYEGGIQDITI